ncbi:hypothetical protein JXZ92_00265 [Mycoplasma sp. CSL10137]|uniref:hypothetical protein n=1 Tax=Mycoplasma sp. CSL10137 TaxID=2813824 RepID=UPI00197C6E11|nr:hypothetical protein [Mycoplasma sp. CSL10137]MBN4083256.1 hypothetical protein [Mycoplasma sp. CSL10137]
MSKKYRKIFTNLMAGSMLLGSVATMAMSCGSSTSKEKEKPSPVAPEQPSNPAKPDTKNDTPSDSTNNDSKNELKLSLDKVTEYLKTLSDVKYVELRQELEQEYQRANSIYSSNSVENDVYVSAKINLDKAYEKTVENKKLIDDKPTNVPPVEEDTKQGKDEEEKPGGETTTESEDKTKNESAESGEQTPNNEDETSAKTDEESSKENQKDKTEDKGSENGKTNTGSEGESTTGESEDKTKDDGDKTGKEASDNQDEDTSKSEDETTTDANVDSNKEGTSKEKQDDKTEGSETGKADTESEGEGTTGESEDKTKDDKGGEQTSNNKDETTAKTDNESSKENQGDKTESSETGNDQTGPEDANIEKTTEDSMKELNYEYVEVKKLLSNSNVNEYLKTAYPDYTFKKYDGTDLEENRLIQHGELIKLFGTKVEDNNKKYALVSIQSSGFVPVDLNSNENSNVLSGNTNIELNVEKSYYDYTDSVHPNQKRSTELPKIFDGIKVESSRWDNWIDYGLDQSHNVFYFNRKNGSNESKIFGLRAWTRVSGFNPRRGWDDFDKYNHNQKVELQNGKSMSPEWIKIYSSSTGEEGSYKLVTGQNKVNDSELFKIKVVDGFRLIDETVNVGNLKETNNIYGVIINFQPTTDKYFKFEFEAPTIPNLKDPEDQENRVFTTDKGFIGFSEIEFIELKNDIKSINDKVQASENASTSFTALEHFGDSFKLNIDNKEVELNGNEQTLSIQVPEGKTFEEVFKTLFDQSTIKNSDNSNLQEGIYTFGYISEVTTNAKTQNETGAKAKIVVTDGTTEHKKEFTINLTKAEVSTPTEETNQ